MRLSTCPLSRRWMTASLACVAVLAACRGTTGVATRAHTRPTKEGARTLSADVQQIVVRSFTGGRTPDGREIDFREQYPSVDSTVDAILKAKGYRVAKAGSHVESMLKYTHASIQEFFGGNGCFPFPTISVDPVPDRYALPPNQALLVVVTEVFSYHRRPTCALHDVLHPLTDAELRYANNPRSKYFSNATVDLIIGGAIVYSMTAKAQNKDIVAAVAATLDGIPARKR